MNPLFTASLLLASALTVHAQTPTQMSYQGRVSDTTGALLGAQAPVNRTVTFKFYATSTGGTPVYAEQQTVTISGGEFSVLIGSGTGVTGFHGPSAPATTPYISLASVMSGPMYLGVTVDDGTAAADPEVTPRQQIVSGAYAFRAKVAEGLVDGSLSTSMLADTSVSTNKIGASAVTSAKIADANITTAKIADAGVTSVKITNGAVTGEKIAGNAVTSDKIADGSITSADIGNDQINSTKIADGSVGSPDIADGQVGTADLANGAVTQAKIANGTIDYARLVAEIQQSLCPVGTILPFAGDNAPAGWVLCNGTALNRTTYAGLYAVVGTRFGTTAGDNFLAPDFRGRFLRGRDGNIGRDDDRNSRVAMNPGGAAGDAVGSVQDDQLRSHAHGYQDIYFSEHTGANGVYVNGRGSGDSDNDNEPWEVSRTTSAAGGNETRPENANVNYIIKF